jgi:hypothetical protein
MFRALVASLLIAWWLPATMHCAIEAAGWMDGGESCPHHCDNDRCDQLESGNFRPTNGAVVIVAPAAAVVDFAVPLVRLAPQSAGRLRIDLARTAAPPGLARTWQFAARAAPQPGAPSPAS